MYSEQDNSAKVQQETTRSSMSSDFGWSSENDTDSESEQTFTSIDCNLRRKNFETKSHKYLFDNRSRAAPVTIPARTHDFGWCDEDDARDSFSACSCGNACHEFFHNDGHEAAWSNQCKDLSKPNESIDELIFDMEM